MLKFTARLLGSLSIRYKLFFSYFLIAIFPVAAVGFFSCNIALYRVKMQNADLVGKNTGQYGIYVSGNLDSFAKLTDAIYFDTKIQDIIACRYVNSQEEYDLIRGYAEPLLNSLLSSAGERINLDLIRFSSGGSEIINNNYSDIGLDSTAVSDILSSTFNIYNEQRVIYSSWFKWFRQFDWFMEEIGKYSEQAVEKTELGSAQTEKYIVQSDAQYAAPLCWAQTGIDTEYGNISLFRPIADFTCFTRKYIGLLKLTVKLEDVIGEGAYEKSGDGGVCLVFDGSGRLLSNEKRKKEFFLNNMKTIIKMLYAENQSARSETIFTHDFIFVKESLGSSGWSIIGASSAGEFNKAAEEIRNMTVFYCAAALLVLMIVTGIISDSFSRRIGRISWIMGRFRSGNFDVRITDHNNDEIGYLAASFNDMAQRIDSLIRDNYQVLIGKREAQLVALQAQINPHFLYNSLSAIGRLADVGDIEGINGMVKALATFYRISLSRGREIISVADELEHVGAYINIYKIRKGEDFKVHFDIDRDVLECATIKMILQPFVENALEHAICNRTVPLNINISALCTDKCVEFRIIDDGVGIRHIGADGLPEPGSSSGSGYGIRNVNERIKLNFGVEYGVRIFSRPGIGTAVEVSIPKRQYENSATAPANIG